MVQETEVLPFLVWFAPSLLHWLAVVATVAGVALCGCWLFAVIRHGPATGSQVVFKTLGDGLADLALTSPRRTLALAWLAVKESLRRRVVAVFAVFLLLLLFAGWFLDPGSSDPGRLYISFVLTATSYLVLLLAVFLSALSIPADVKNRTLFTVVTKPVRASEIVLGRILGFVAVGSGLLAVMALMSYLFVVRGVNHSHSLALADLEPDKTVAAAPGNEAPASWTGRTNRAQRHRHKVVIDASGRGRVETENGHWHDLSVDPKLLIGLSANSPSVVETGGTQGLLMARVPVYGKLRFHDRSGRETAKGISVGDEWTYRSYIEGGTLAAAIWTFDNLRAADYPDGLPVEMNIGIFRTHKGNIEKGVLAALEVHNPRTGQKVEARIFPAKEFVIDRQLIPRELHTADGRKLDLFADLVSDGSVEIWLRSLEPAQYFGAARADLYLRARDVTFAGNFLKGYWGIWMQMTLLVGIGVMFSTFLSGPVATLATLGTLLGGLTFDFVSQVAHGKVVGGGPAEALIRILTQDNVVSELEPGLRTTAAKMIDKAAEQILSAVASLLPDFDRFSFSTYVADGFDIPWDLVASGTVTTLAFVLPLLVAGYFFLATREVGQ